MDINSIELRTLAALTEVQERSRKECGHVRPRGDCLSCRQVLLTAVMTRAEAERRRQDTRWGVQDHSPYTWLVILIEEVGEAAEAALKASFGPDHDKYLVELEEELNQVVAVAMAAQECLIRGDWRRRQSHLDRERIDIAHELMGEANPAEKAAMQKMLDVLTGGRR